MESNEHPGVIIGRLLTAHRVSQSNLARQLKVSRQAVKAWLDGTNTPTLSNLIEISRIFNVSLSIFGDNEVERSIVDNDLRQLPPETSALLVKMFRAEIQRVKKIGKLG